MSTSLDFNLLPLARQAGQEQLDLPGLLAATPPRRPARGRGTDLLILYFSVLGNAPLSPGKQDQILTRLAKTYYDTSGSVTAALRTVTDTLNQFLLDRNLRNANTGRQAVGLLTMVTIRGSQLYLAHSGPVHSLLITAGHTEHFHDAQLSGQGLGLSRSTPIRYYQAVLQPNDNLLLAAQFPPTWSAGVLAGLHGQGPESIRRRLLGQATSDINAALLQARPGSGKIHLLRARSAPQPEAFREVQLESAGAIESPVEDGSIPGGIVPEETRVNPLVQPSGPPLSLKPVAQESVPLSPTSSGEPLPQGREMPANVPPVLSSEKAASPAARSQIHVPRFRSLTAGFVRDFNAGTRQIGRVIMKFVGRVLPNESLLAIPSVTMAFIAIAVPVVVVTMAMVVYLRQGLAAQSNALYEQALQLATQAEGQTDPSERRQTWETTLSYVGQAQAYGNTPELQELRTRTQNALDELDLVRRTGYQPAIIGGLPEEVNVSRMIIVSGDLYLLDSNSGSVWRAFNTNISGYEIDGTFQCGPGFPGGAGVGPLLDIVPMPPGSDPDSVLMGIDPRGGLLTCFLSQPPRGVALARPATAANWGSLVAVTLDQDQGHLYVLDPADRAVWVYWNSNFAEPPQFFFSEEVPSLVDTVDLVVNRNELYLLHKDGHLTLCNFSNLGVAPTRCIDPAPYIDFRPGKENTPFVPSSPFGQILFTPPPDPSLYLLQPADRAIYHFSLRSLGFQSQYLPAGGVQERPASAFAVSNIDHAFFLAVGNQVYYANVP